MGITFVRITPYIYIFLFYAFIIPHIQEIFDKVENLLINKISSLFIFSFSFVHCSKLTKLV